MSNTRFALPSANNVLTATLINGDVGYTNAPAKSQDTQYPMTNLLNGDRYSAWRAGTSAPNPTVVDFDFGSSISVATMAVHGFRLPSGGSGPTQVIFKYQVSSYDGSGSWTTKSTVSLSGAPRDAGTVTTGTSARYWRAEFTAPSDGFSVGVIYIGVTPTDTGVLYSPNAQDAVVHNRWRSNTPMGAPVINEVGDEGRILSLPFNSINTTTKDALVAVARSTDPVSYFSPFNEAMQVLILRDEHTSRHAWSPNDLWDTTLDLMRLP